MVRAIVRQAATEGNTFEAIVKGVVESPAFRMRQTPVAPTQQGPRQAALDGVGSPDSRHPGGNRHVHHQEASVAPHRSARRGRGDLAAAARRHDPGGHRAGQHGGRAEAAPRILLLPARRDHGEVDAGQGGHRLRAEPDPRAAGAVPRPAHRRQQHRQQARREPRGARARARQPGSPACIRKRAWRPSMAATVDQIAALQIGQDTPYPSLEIATAQGHGVGSACERGYGCSYSGTLSFRNASTPLPIESNPRQLFLRLFGQGDSLEERAVPGAPDEQPARHDRERGRLHEPHARAAGPRHLERLPRQRARDRAARAERRAQRRREAASCRKCRAPPPRTSTST